MATTYPGAVDSLPRPTSATQMDASGFEGDVVVDNLSDAVEAIETELGTDPAGSFATVKARLAGIEGSTIPLIPTHYYQTGLSVGNSANTSSAHIANRIRGRLVVVPRAISIDRLGVAVLSANTGATLRLGLFEDDGGVPGAEVVNPGGTLDCSTTGFKEQSFTAVAVPAGVYWALAQTGGASCTTRLDADSQIGLGRAAGSDVTMERIAAVTRTDADMPADLSGLSWGYDDLDSHGIFWRVAP